MASPSRSPARVWSISAMRARYPPGRSPGPVRTRGAGDGGRANVAATSWARGTGVQPTERNVGIVREYRAAFGSGEPARYEPFLAPAPVCHTGMVRRRGRAAFHQLTAAAHVLHP